MLFLLYLSFYSCFPFEPYTDTVTVIYILLLILYQSTHFKIYKEHSENNGYYLYLQKLHIQFSIKSIPGARFKVQNTSHKVTTIGHVYSPVTDMQGQSKYKH